MIRDTGKLLAAAVAETLDAIDRMPEDAAARKLAAHYAAVIDSQDSHCRGCDDDECKRAAGSAWALRWLGPLLLDALESLGATPLARSRLKKGDKPDGKPSGIQRIRDARRA